MLIKTIDDKEKQFYFTTKLSNNIEVLDNGYLRCNNVIMGRTGTQQYTTKELNIETTDGRNHVINVNRHEEDVFHPETLESIEGKPLTIGHPRNEDGSVKFVTVDNVNDLRVGYILNVRRSDNNIIGDIIIENKEAIDLVTNKGIKELSLGYLPKYELDGDDSLKQTKIVVNHLAIVQKGRAGNARIVDEANQEIEEKRGEQHLDKDTLFTKFLKVFGIKKATLDDDTEITVGDEQVDETPKVKIIEQVIENQVVPEEPKEEKTADETPDVEVEVEPNKDVDEPVVVEQPTGDDSIHTVKSTVEETHDGEYYKETKVVQTVETTVFHEKTEEETEKEKKEKEIPMITFDEAMQKIKGLDAIKGTEAYEKQIATVDAEMVEAGLGSILKKTDGGKIDIFNSVVPKSVETGDENKVPKFKAENFIKGIGAVYAQFTPKALDKVSKLTVDRAVRIKELGSIEPRELFE